MATASRTSGVRSKDLTVCIKNNQQTKMWPYHTHRKFGNGSVGWCCCQRLVKVYCIYPPASLHGLRTRGRYRAGRYAAPLPSDLLPLTFAAQGKGKLWGKTCPTHLPSCHSNTFEAVNVNTAAPSRCTLKVAFRKLVMKVFSKQFSPLFLPHTAWDTARLVCTAVWPRSIILLI